jgi:hypothetical protein
MPLLYFSAPQYDWPCKHRFEIENRLSRSNPTFTGRSIVDLWVHVADPISREMHRRRCSARRPLDATRFVFASSVCGLSSTAIRESNRLLRRSHKQRFLFVRCGME